MLPATNRIRKKKEFDQIFKNSRSLKAKLFIFRISKNELGVNRVGFIVSQKVSKKATMRNKLRRRMSEIISGKINNIKNGTDIILIALAGAEKMEFAEIREEIEGALFRGKLII